MNNWEYLAPEENFIPRGEGKYPQGEFDCGCIYASIPVEIDDKLFFYYMGGNGQHTNYRETSFARGYIEKDKFAYYSPKTNEQESILITSGFSIFGNELNLLADIEQEGYIHYEILDPSTREIVDGFSSYKDKPITTSGWNELKFKVKNLTELSNTRYQIRFTFNKAKLYALKGFIHL